MKAEDAGADATAPVGPGRDDEWTLSEPARAAGVRLTRFDAAGSTNREALAAARAGEGGPAWFVTDCQTAGTGRRGRAWHGARGDLAATLLLTTRLPPETIATLGFVAGVATVRALRAVTGDGGAPEPPFRLKWPNDVLVDGAKLVGILLGTEPAGEGRRAVAVGIGVNVVSTPADPERPAVSLRALRHGVSAPALFRTLSEAWLDAYALWDGGSGFDAIRRLWLSAAAGLGDPVRVAVGPDVIRGRFETIDGSGRLVVRTSAGEARVVGAGEVHFGTARSVWDEARHDED